MQAKAKPEAQLGESAARARSLGSVVARIIGRNMPPLTYTMRHFFASGAVFFRRSRLFFREAAFFSGGEGCEWRAQRATVGESGDKAENLFLALSHSPSHERASALTSPPPTFCSFPYHNAHNSTIPKIATFPIGLAFRHRAQYLCPRVL